MVEVFAKPGTKSQAKRDLIFNKTGMIPAIYGTTVCIMLLITD